MVDLKATRGNIVIKVDATKKDTHKFDNGTELKLMRGYNNFDQRETQPVQGIVINDFDNYVMEGFEILFQHTCAHPTYQIFNLNSNENNPDIFYYSIPSELCFAWREIGKEWQPMKDCLITTRLWQPYKGIIEMPPSLIKQRLYVKEGKYKGKVIITYKNCDYEIVFQGDNGQENYLISTKGDEVLAIDEGFTKDVNNGKILVGRTANEAEILNQKTQKNAKEQLIASGT